MSEAQPVPDENPRDFDLIQVAMDFAEAKRFDYATIAIQTAVEIYVEQRLSQILAWRNLGPLGDFITDVVRPYTFKNSRLRALWTSLTRDSIQQQDEWWSDYLEHVKRRNLIAHGGRHATEQEVEASLLAAFALMNHVNNVMIETGLRLGKLRELGTEVRPDPDPY